KLLLTIRFQLSEHNSIARSQPDVLCVRTRPQLARAIQILKELNCRVVQRGAARKGVPAGVRQHVPHTLVFSRPFDGPPPTNKRPVSVCRRLACVDALPEHALMIEEVPDFMDERTGDVPLPAKKKVG